jgi:acyl-coenzyme A synthetase/AMP-(fatty) acid ligase
MHTGDEASMDENGYVRITGRIKDLIIRGGENIHPLEIENAILKLPSVTDVSVVGLPDPKYGEVVAAFIMPKNANANEEEKVKMAREIKTWVKETLSPHLVPKYIFWSDGWPKTASGKIQKFKLRETGVELAETGQGLYAWQYHQCGYIKQSDIETSQHRYSQEAFETRVVQAIHW